MRVIQIKVGESLFCVVKSNYCEEVYLISPFEIESKNPSSGLMTDHHLEISCKHLALEDRTHQKGDNPQ